MTIRGNNSIAGTNQALVILDGVPLISSSYSTDSFTESSTTASSRLSDIDPNNIAEITVLKGYAAATLYGTAGKNGVILIKTKSGSKGKGGKMNMSLSQGFFINQAVLPKYQDEYGMGTNNVTQGWFFSNWGASFNDKDIKNFFGGAYVGPNGYIMLPHPYRTIPNAPDDFNNFGLRSEFANLANAFIEYKPYRSVENFFANGSLSTTSLNISKGFEGGSIGSSMSYHDETGVIPNNTLRKFNLSVGGAAALNDKLDLTASINYMNKDTKTPPISAGYGSGVSGSGSSILSDVYYTPRNIDLMGMPFEGPLSKRSVYYRANNGIQNPRWTAKYTSNIEKTDRAVLGSSLTYKPFAGTAIKYNFGLDAINHKSEYRIARGGTQSTLTNNGFYRTMTFEEKIFNHDLVFSWNKDDLFAEGLSLSFVAGGQAKRNTYIQTGISSTGQDTFDFWEHSNFKTSSGKNLFNGVDLDYRSNVNTLGLYASAEFGFKEMLYLSLQGRNDWTSVLEKDYRQIFYPSAGV